MEVTLDADSGGCRGSPIGSIQYLGHFPCETILVVASQVGAVRNEVTRVTLWRLREWSPPLIVWKGHECILIMQHPHKNAKFVHD